MIFDRIRLSALPSKNSIDWLADYPQSELIVRSDKNDPHKKRPTRAADLDNRMGNPWIKIYLKLG